MFVGVGSTYHQITRLGYFWFLQGVSCLSLYLSPSHHQFSITRETCRSNLSSAPLKVSATLAIHVSTPMMSDVGSRNSRKCAHATAKSLNKRSSQGLHSPVNESGPL
jgi:hypothetical protein